MEIMFALYIFAMISFILCDICDFLYTRFFSKEAVGEVQSILDMYKTIDNGYRIEVEIIYRAEGQVYRVMKSIHTPIRIIYKGCKVKLLYNPKHPKLAVISRIEVVE